MPPGSNFGGLERGEGVAVQQLDAVVEPAEFADRRAELRVARVAAFECADLPFKAVDLGAYRGVVGLVDRGERYPLGGPAAEEGHQGGREAVPVHHRPLPCRSSWYLRGASGPKEPPASPACPCRSSW